MAKRDDHCTFESMNRNGGPPLNTAAPDAREPAANRLRTLLIISAIWLGIGVITTQFSYLALQRTGANPSWSMLFRDNLFSVVVWALFTPLIVWIATVKPIARATWPGTLLIHVAACLAFAVADVVLERAFSQVFGLHEVRRADAITLFLRRVFLNSLCYAVIVATATAVNVSRQARQREITTTRLASLLASARLQALQAQLQPHFLFNTLSMIAERVHVDPDGADRMIGRLGQLLRGSLATSGRQEVTLAEELRLLAAYLDIMSVRLSDRAEFSIDVPPDLVECALPALILQPLAENSFSHGIERRKDGGLLAIKARRRDESLEVELSDNGGGFDPAEFREGVGLRVVRERLHELYGANGSLSVRPRPEGGTSAMVRVPFRRLETSNGRYVEELAQ